MDEVRSDPTLLKAAADFRLPVVATEDDGELEAWQAERSGNDASAAARFTRTGGEA